MDNAKIAKTLKYLKDCWYSEYYTDDEYSDEQYDEITEVVDYVISDILKINNEDVPAFKVGDIVRLKDSMPKLDDCDVAVVTWSSERSTYMYVMRSDGSCGMEEDMENWYKVGRITWFAKHMKDLKQILEEY